MTKDIPYDLWQPVIGLEMHVQLNTKSKLFSSAANHFGDEPNTNISFVCTGEPGTLPTLNREAVKKAIRFGLAVNAKIEPISIFERKSYFYPDTPRNFQITQMAKPVLTGGTIITEMEGKTKEFSLHHAHLEDDAGMLKHFSSFAGVDFNRAGVPLLEIVSTPTMHSPKEAIAYVTAIKAIMEYINASECNMEEGHLRVDANISVRPKGETGLRNKTEIKNMNSFAYLEMAIAAEITRQIRIYSENPHTDMNILVPQMTYRWDSVEKTIVEMRKKESAEDYRYFPEPDLMPLIITQKEIDEIAKTMPELPYERFLRYVKDFEISEYSAAQLITDKHVADFFEEALKECPNARALCNWITVEFAGRLKDSNKTVAAFGIKPSHIAKLVNMIEQGKINGKIAKKVADDMILSPKEDPETIVKNNPEYRPLSDAGLIEELVDTVILQNPQSVLDFKAGNFRALGFLMGQIMKLSQGKCDPQMANDLLRQKIAN